MIRASAHTSPHAGGTMTKRSACSRAGPVSSRSLRFPSIWPSRSSNTANGWRPRAVPRRPIRCSCKRATRLSGSTRNPGWSGSPTEESKNAPSKAPARSRTSASDAAVPPEVTVQLVCVCTAECWPVLVQPFKEGDLSQRGLMRDQQPRGQATNLVGGEDDVAYDKAECARERGHRGGRCMLNGPTTTESVPNGSNEFFKRHRVRPGGVDDHAAATVRGLETDAREIVDVDRLHQVAAVARHDEERHASQDPGDVVGQDVPPTAEEERWPDDRVRNVGTSQRLLDECFAAVVGQRRIDRRIRDAHVNDASDAG